MDLKNKTDLLYFHSKPQGARSYNNAGHESYPVGVFEASVNQRAFVDRAVFSSWGVKRCKPRGAVFIDRNPAIGGKGRPYARAVHGFCCVTGNPFEMKYGRLRNFENVPDFMLTVRSDKLPLTGAQVMLVADALLRKGFKLYPSAVEMTFDIDCVDIPSLLFRMSSAARTRRELEDGNGNRCVYIGSSRSRWQLRIYQKTRSIVRVEYVFRSPFLRAVRIHEPHELIRLRKVNLWKLVRYSAPGIQRLLREMGSRIIW